MTIQAHVNSTNTVVEPSRRIAPFATITMISLALAVGGCTRGTDLNQGGLFSSSSTSGDPLPPRGNNSATSLQPAPSPQVQAQPIQPASPTPPPPPNAAPQQPVQPVKPQQVEVAKVEPAPKPAASSKPVTREALIGRWTVTANGSNCDIFLALTKWANGFRAAARGCSATSIGSVQAWNVQGNQVILYGDGGQTVATLNRSGEERYNGTAGGGPISFSR